MKGGATPNLLQRLAKGDEKAFRIIYETYWERLFKICFYFSRSREESEDMLMSIFSTLWHHRAHADVRDLDAYLSRAAKNQALKYITRKQRQQAQLGMLRERISSRKQDVDSPERLLEYKELSSQFSAQLGQLPEKTRKIFLMNREEGLTYPEIARTLDVSVKTVEYHVSRALSFLGKTILVIASFVLFHFFS